MPRPRRPIRPVKVHISIPEDHWAELQLQLYSPLEGRVPHGKVSEWFEALSRQALEKVKEARACTCALSTKHCPVHADTSLNSGDLMAAMLRDGAGS